MDQMCTVYFALARMVAIAKSTNSMSKIMSTFPVQVLTWVSHTICELADKWPKASRASLRGPDGACKLVDIGSARCLILRHFSSSTAGKEIYGSLLLVSDPLLKAFAMHTGTSPLSDSAAGSSILESMVTSHAIAHKQCNMSLLFSML